MVAGPHVRHFTMRLTIFSDGGSGVGDAVKRSEEALCAALVLNSGEDIGA